MALNPSVGTARKYSSLPEKICAQADLAAVLSAYHQAAVDEAAAKARKAEASALLMAWAEAEGVVDAQAGGFLLHIVERRSKTLDAKAIRAFLGDKVAEFERESVQRFPKVK